MFLRKAVMGVHQFKEHDRVAIKGAWRIRCHGAGPVSMRHGQLRPALLGREPWGVFCLLLTRTGLILILITS